jgi:endonuclease/exonuclease/phosphatase (EEP) superfamily protein YafD
MDHWDLVLRTIQLMRILVMSGWIILAGLMLVSVILLFELRSWPYELLHHFSLHYLLLSSLLMILFLLLRRKIAASSAAILLLVFAGFSWNAYRVSNTGPYSARISPDVGQEHKRPLIVITHNVSDTNKNHREVRKWLRSKPADVVVLQEVPSREAALYREDKIFKHQLEVYDAAFNDPDFPDDRVLVILSQYALSQEPKFKPFEGSRPVVIVRVSVPHTENPWVVVVDAYDPTSSKKLVKRDKFLLGIAPIIRELNGPVVVAGDFNATPCTPVFKDFLRLADLSLWGLPVPTFPAQLGWLGISIDHILVRHVQVTDVETLSSMGSDHRPLKAILTIP